MWIFKFGCPEWACSYPSVRTKACQAELLGAQLALQTLKAFHNGCHFTAAVVATGAAPTAVQAPCRRLLYCPWATPGHGQIRH